MVLSQTLTPRSHQQAPAQTFVGLDYLRAIFSVVVVALHVNLFVVLTGKVKLTAIADFFNRDFGYLAVPVFFQIALFLFLLKDGRSPNYFRQNRLPKLLSLYGFWVSAKLLFDWILTQQTDQMRSALTSVTNLFVFIISGGHSAFYFFFALIVITTIATGYNRWLNRIPVHAQKIKLQYVLLIVSCLMVFTFPVIYCLTGRYEYLTDIPNFLSFLPYIFTASIVVNELQSGQLQHLTRSLRCKLWTLLGLWLLFMIIEWLCFQRFPHYSRISLVFGSWLLLYLALLLPRSTPPLIKRLSSCSLGIYGFHVFFVDHTQGLEKLSSLLPGLGPLSRFGLALGGSIALTLLLKRYKCFQAFL